MSLQFSKLTENQEKILFRDDDVLDRLLPMTPSAVVNLINTYAQTCIYAETIEPQVLPPKLERRIGLKKTERDIRNARHKASCKEVLEANRMLEDCKKMAPDRLASGLELLRGLRAYEEITATSFDKADVSIGVTYFESKRNVRHQALIGPVKPTSTPSQHSHNAITL